MPNSISFKSIVFRLYIICLTLLPAGSVAGVNLKVITFIPLFIVCLQLLANETGSLRQFAFLNGVAATFMIWAVRSLVSPFYAEWSMSQYKDIITTLLGCLFVRLLTKDESSRRAFVRLCVYTVAFGCLLKILALMYSSRTGVPVSNIVDRISALFRVKLMTIELGDFGGRLQFPSDNLLPIVLFAVLSLRKRLHMRGLEAFLIVGLFLISSLYTFSRYLWASTAVALCLGIFVSKKDKLHIFYLGTFVALAAFFHEQLSILIDLRFSNALAGSSDQTRMWQIGALWKFFWDAPLFGNGMGSYVLQHVRSVDLPYAYEVQLLALAAEFGVIGMGIFTFLLVNYYRKAFSFQKGAYSYQVSVGLMLFCFLGAGLFNPCLLVSMSAVSYGLLFVLASLGSYEGESLASGGRRQAFFLQPSSKFRSI